MKQRVDFVFRAASGIAYHGTETGTGPALLFLHGFTGHKTAYPAFLAQLARACTVISLDLPGHGHTVMPATVPSGFMQVVADLAQFLKDRAMGPVHGVGYSMGGRLALALTLQFPEGVRSLTLIGASPGIASPALRQRRRARDQDLAAFMTAVPAAVFRDYWDKLPLFAHGPPVPARRPCGLSGHNDRTDNLARSLSILGTGTQPSFWQSLPALHRPVQLIVGSHDVKYGQVARAMQDRLPHSRMELIPGAGHRAHVDQPGEVSARIMEHIFQQP